MTPLHHGSVAGFSVVDSRVAVYDGSYHTVDSSQMAFKNAASMGFKKALETAHPVLLEPIMSVEVEAPADHIGGVIRDLNARRGRILHVEAKDQTEQITALVPRAELRTYATVLNSLTAGRGSYAMEITRYDEVPRDLADRVIDAHMWRRTDSSETSIMNGLPLINTMHLHLYLDLYLSFLVLHAI